MRIRCPIFATDIGAIGKGEIAFGHTVFVFVFNTIAIMVAVEINTLIVASDL